MPGSQDLPPRIPQRVVVTGAAGSTLDTFVQRTADVLDVPLVPLAELSGAEEVARLAAFDGWVTTGEYDAGRAALLDRAELVVHLDVAEPTTLTGLVRRTLRRVRADAAPPPDRTWLAAAAGHPGLPVLRLARVGEVEDWLHALGG